MAAQVPTGTALGDYNARRGQATQLRDTGRIGETWFYLIRGEFTMDIGLETRIGYAAKL